MPRCDLKMVEARKLGDATFMRKRRRRSRLELFHARAERIESRLRSLSFSQLDAAMSSESSAGKYTSHILGSRIVPIAEKLTSDTIQVVIQGFLPLRWFFGSHVHVSGFRRTRDERIEELTDEELWSYD